MHSREHGAHTRNEQCVTSVSGFGMTFQFTLGSGARREPFRTPQAICTLLVHLFMPTMHLGPAATDSLYAESSTFS